MSDLDFDSLPTDEPSISVESDDADTEMCDVCGRTGFKNARGLKRHKTVAHGLRSEPDSKPKSLRRNSSLQKELQEFIMMISMMVALANANDGAIIAGNAERLAHAFDNLARQNKPFRNFLEGLMKTGAMGEVAAAVMFTAIPIMMNHGKLPADVMRVFGGMMPVAPEPE